MNPIYESLIAKQIPKAQGYKPRMGLQKSKDFFFRVDSEFAKTKRIEALKDKANILFAEEDKDIIIESLRQFYPPLELMLGNSSDNVIQKSFQYIAKVSDVDLLILDKEMKIKASSVCFPTGWDPKEKLGKTVIEAHETIPNVNKQIGNSISVFIESLPCGDLYQRSNIGFIGEDVLDARPSKNVRKITKSLSINEIWVRVEQQGITKLENGYVVFGIRVENIPLKLFIMSGENKQGLISMLRTIPKEMAEYKGITEEARARILSLIGY